MKRQCPFIKDCPLYDHLLDSVKPLFAEMRCEGDFTKCAYCQLRLAGHPEPASLVALVPPLREIVAQFDEFVQHKQSPA